jgi:chromosome segregation ATPase
VINKSLAESDNNWDEKITELESQLDEIRPQLIEAEAELADRLAKISAFEFKVRTRLEPLTRRLEKIQTEIHEQRQQLRRLRENLVSANSEQDFFDKYGWVFNQESSAASGDYRYREASDQPPATTLNENDTTSLKQLYRQLARRFHPDLALDDADREYRTGIMKAINAAYAAGDVARLEELVQEPDSADRMEYAHTNQQLVQAMYIELTRCHRRLNEIKEEIAHLENHKSVRLMRRAERAAAAGRDLLDELYHELQNEIAHKLIERDVLKEQVELFDQESADYTDDAFADAVYDLSLEGIFDDDDDDITMTARWPEHRSWDDDILDDME